MSAIYHQKFFYRVETAHSFFAQFITMLYSCSYADTLFLCGDFNARIGKDNKVIEGFDDIIKRVVIDDVENPRGDVYVDLMRDMQFCTVNGKITPEYDNYTFLAYRGKYVIKSLSPNLNKKIIQGLRFFLK